MPNQIIWENHGVLSQYYGEFNPELHGKVLNLIFSNPRTDTLKYIIADYSDLNDISLTKKNIKFPFTVTVGASYYLRNIQVALVATDKNIRELCKKYIEVFSQSNTTWKVRLFYSLNDARDWVS
ncbi:MAG: hypothetical protein ABFS32_16000 [Bacteroidota bacterium]